MIRIRRALQIDISVIGYIHSQTWKTAYEGIVQDSYLAKKDTRSSEQQILRQMQSGTTHMLVAEIDDAVVGFADFGVSKSPSTADGQLHSIYVLASYQGQGVGQALLEACMKKAREAGMKSIFVSVLTDNLQAVRFYKNSGAELVDHDCLILDGVRYQTDTYVWKI